MYKHISIPLNNVVEKLKKDKNITEQKIIKVDGKKIVEYTTDILDIHNDYIQLYREYDPFLEEYRLHDAKYFISDISMTFSHLKLEEILKELERILFAEQLHTISMNKATGKISSYKAVLPPSGWFRKTFKKRDVNKLAQDYKKLEEAFYQKNR